MSKKYYQELKMKIFLILLMLQVVNGLIWYKVDNMTEFMNDNGLNNCFYQEGDGVDLKCLCDGILIDVEIRLSTLI